MLISFTCEMLISFTGFREMLIFLIASALSLASSTEVFDNLGSKILPGFKLWNSTDMEENHSNRQPNQDPSRWTNLSFPIPDYVTKIQFVACSTSNATQEIPFYAVDELGRVIDISVTWWGVPWSLHMLVSR